MTEPYELSDQFVMARGIRFHYAQDGERENPVIALVNMASHNLTVWEHCMDGLSRRHNVLRFDIRGTGKSGWGQEWEFTFANYAEDLAAIMTELGVDRAFVVGNDRSWLAPVSTSAICSTPH